MGLDSPEPLFKRDGPRKPGTLNRKARLRRGTAGLLERAANVSVSAGFENRCLCHGKGLCLEGDSVFATAKLTTGTSGINRRYCFRRDSTWAI